MNARLIALLAATALLHSPAFAQNLAEWDANASSTISESEFTNGFRGAGMFADWDGSADGQLASPELAEGLYGFWDRDSDGDLSVDEWDRAVNLWLGETDIDLSAFAWDADGNGLISEFEFANAFGQLDLVTRFDSDDENETLDEAEVATGLFQAAAGEDGDGIAIEDGGFFADVAEVLDDPVDPVDPLEPSLDLIEAGRSFTQLPVPCGTDGDCAQVATDFCSALGYGEPIDTLAMEDQLYVVRCTDDPIME